MSNRSAGYHMYITKLVDSKLSPNHLLVKDGQPSVVMVDVGVSVGVDGDAGCLLYTSPSPRDATLSRMPSSA